MPDETCPSKSRCSFLSLCEYVAHSTQQPYSVICQISHASKLTREELKQQKAHYYECIRVVNTHLNALLPISRLPPEILSNIFLRHVQAARNRAGMNSATVQPMKLPCRRWIRVTHVCTHWRDVALQCPALWCYIKAPGSLRMLRTFLARSKDAPLTVSMSLCGSRLPFRNICPEPNLSEKSLMLVLAALHRVRQLHMKMYFGPLQEALEQINGPAPLLESLSIEGSFLSPDGSKLRSSVTSMVSHPESRLKCLTTEFNCLLWDTIVLNHLTRLEVHGCSGEVSRTDVMSFFHALAHIPLLEQLELHRVFISYRRNVSSVIALLDPIPLSRLRRLRLRYACIYTMTDLLNNLHTPHLSQLSITVTDDGSEVYAPFLAAMAHKTTTLGQPLTVALSNDEVYHETFTRMYDELCCSAVEPKDDVPTPAWFERHAPIFEYRLGHSKGEFDGALIPSICQLFHVTEVKTLLLGANFPVRGQWPAIARCFEAVTEFRLYGAEKHLVDPGMSFGSQKQSAGDDGHTSQVALPNLRIFTMDGIDFSLGASREEEFRKRGTAMVSDLAACFAQRAEDGAELQMLRILCAEMLWPQDLERFREAVRCVESDGASRSLWFRRGYLRHTDR